MSFMYVNLASRGVPPSMKDKEVLAETMFPTQQPRYRHPQQETGGHAKCCLHCLALQWTTTKRSVWAPGHGRVKQRRQIKDLALSRPLESCLWGTLNLQASTYVMRIGDFIDGESDCVIVKIMPKST